MTSTTTTSTTTTSTPTTSTPTAPAGRDRADRPAGRHAGRVVVVTGAGQGIGRAFAAGFAAEGAAVAAVDVHDDAARVTADRLTAGGAEAIALRGDVTDPEDMARAVREVTARWGRLDVLVNNAAVFSTIRMKPFDEIPLAEWEQVVRVNLTGTFVACQAVTPAMREAGAGRIVNISSSTVLMGRTHYAHYVASKAGVVGLTRALARELGPDGITVNAILPGSTETEVPRETVSPEQARAIVSAQSVKRRIQAGDIVGAALFLASEEADFVTGQSIVVDGGLNFV